MFFQWNSKNIETCECLNFENNDLTIFRGTKLLADRMHEMHSNQMQREKETLEKIKLKVERIKANQQKFEPNLIPAKTHHAGNSTFAIKMNKT